MKNRTKHILQYAQTVKHFTATQYMQDVHVDMSDTTLHSVVNILNRMVREGKLQRVQRGVYARNYQSQWQKWCEWCSSLSGFAASPLINPPLENSQIFVFRLKI